MNVVKYSSKFSELISKFDCGNSDINLFLKNVDLSDPNNGVTYIWLTESLDNIIGFYNIEVGRVDRVEFISGNPLYIPMGGAVNINYLAINKEYQHTQLSENTYYGDYLLWHCEDKIVSIRQDIGISFITASITNEAYNMYIRRNEYDHFDEDMNNFVQESDKTCYKVYKWIDDIS